MKNRCEKYDVGGVSITATCLKSRVVVLTGEIRTIEELATAAKIIANEAAKRSSFTPNELYDDVMAGEVPHALVLLRYCQPVRLGFDITNAGLGLFVEHNGDLPPEQELEVLQAPGDQYMSRSDRQRVRKIQMIMANR